MVKVYVWKIRTAKHITLMELSQLSRLGKSTINNIETGKTSPTLNQLESLARALNVSMEELYDSPYKANGEKYFHNYGNI